MAYIFTLEYQLTDDSRDVDALRECLAGAGCADVLVRARRPGQLVIEFTREGPDAESAMRDALADVHRAFPSAVLIEVSPDLLGLADVAGIVGVSRQNMRKLVRAHPDSFPAPMHAGTASLWHLADVLTWLRGRGDHKLPENLLDVSRAAMRFNIAMAQQRILANYGGDMRDDFERAVRMAAFPLSSNFEAEDAKASSIQAAGQAGMGMGDTLAAIGRKIGLSNEDFIVLDSVRENLQPKAARFD